MWYFGPLLTFLFFLVQDEWSISLCFMALRAPSLCQPPASTHLPSFLVSSPYRGRQPGRGKQPEESRVLCLDTRHWIRGRQGIRGLCGFILVRLMVLPKVMAGEYWKRKSSILKEFRGYAGYFWWRMLGKKATSMAKQCMGVINGMEEGGSMSCLLDMRSQADRGEQLRHGRIRGKRENL